MDEFYLSSILCVGVLEQFVSGCSIMRTCVVLGLTALVAAVALASSETPAWAVSSVSLPSLDGLVHFR